MVDGNTDDTFKTTVKKKTASGAEINENEKAVSYGSQLLEKAGIFKDFITIIEVDLVMEWKPSKVL